MGPEAPKIQGMNPVEELAQKYDQWRQGVTDKSRSKSKVDTKIQNVSEIITFLGTISNDLNLDQLNLKDLNNYIFKFENISSDFKQNEFQFKYLEVKKLLYLKRILALSKELNNNLTNDQIEEKRNELKKYNISYSNVIDEIKSIQLKPPRLADESLSISPVPPPFFPYYLTIENALSVYHKEYGQSYDELAREALKQKLEHFDPSQPEEMMHYGGIEDGVVEIFKRDQSRDGALFKIDYSGKRIYTQDEENRFNPGEISKKLAKALDQHGLKENFNYLIQFNLTQIALYFHYNFQAAVNLMLKQRDPPQFLNSDNILRDDQIDIHEDLSLTVTLKRIIPVSDEEGGQAKFYLVTTTKYSLHQGEEDALYVLRDVDDYTFTWDVIDELPKNLK